MSRIPTPRLLYTDAISGTHSRALVPRSTRAVVPIPRTGLSPTFGNAFGAGSRGPFLTGTTNASRAEVLFAFSELNARNIFAEGQSDAVTPDDAIRYGVDVALYQRPPYYRQGYIQTQAAKFQGTIRYATKQYITDQQFVDKAMWTIAAARREVGRGRALTGYAAKVSEDKIRSYLPKDQTLFKNILAAALPPAPQSSPTEPQPGTPEYYERVARGRL